MARCGGAIYTPRQFPTLLEFINSKTQGATSRESAFVGFSVGSIARVWQTGAISETQSLESGLPAF
jgi:hypothetical protein